MEQVFRLLKNEGFKLEKCELEEGDAIRKLCVMMLTSLLKVLQMNIAFNDKEEGQPIAEVFDEEEVECLKVLNKKYEGKTKKQKNNCNPKRTKWAAWVIGRLGGWKGYESSRLRREYFRGIQICKRNVKSKYKSSARCVHTVGLRRDDVHY